MNTIEELLRSKPVLFDGATGTELQKRGLPAGIAPELWNLEKPEVVEEVARNYVRAGAFVIETNSFGGNRKRLEAGGIDGKINDVNIGAVKSALKAANKDAVVIGSIGPLGTLIEPLGETSRAEAKDLFREQTEILLKAGVHVVLVETMISLDEALRALAGAKEAGCEEVGVTMTFEVKANGVRTPFGEDVAKVAESLERAGASFIGSNCGNGFEEMLVVAKEMRIYTGLPLLIQPNAGLPVYNGNGISYPGTPEQFTEFVVKAVSMGIDFVGGCCGTTPAHIAAAHGSLEQLRVK